MTSPHTGAQPPGASAELPPELSTISVHSMAFRRPAEHTAPAAPAAVQAPEQTPAPHVFSFHEEVTPVSHRDLRYFSLALTSQFYWYPFKEISFKLVNGLAQAKFTKAATEQNHAVMLEALAGLCATPERFNSLVMTDYQYIMYWLRLSSYTSGTLNAEHICIDPKHRERVAKGTSPPSTLITPVSVARSSMVETLLDPAEMDQVIAECNAVLAPRGLAVNAPRVGDILPGLKFCEDRGAIRSEEEVKSGADEIDPEVRFILDNAGAIQGLDQPLDFESRVRAVEDLSDPEFTAIEKFLEVYLKAGVKEFVTTRCMECGAERRTQVRISALTFLRQG